MYGEMDEPNAELIIASSNSRVSLNRNNFTVGRGYNNIFIIADGTISRLHCIFEKSKDKWTIRDKSTYGTIVNKRQLQKDRPIELNNGDVIKLSSNTILTFNNGKEPEPIDLTDETSSVIDLVDEASNQTHGNFTEASTGTVESTKANEGIDMERLEMEFNCAICTELFVKAVTLNCSHTFCKFCIEEWQKKQKCCPICRTKIDTAFPTIVLDNYIEKVLESASDETKHKRTELLEQRLKQVKETEVKPMAFVTRSIRVGFPLPIDISSDELTDSGSDMDDAMSYDSLFDDSDNYMWHCYVCGDDLDYPCPHRFD